MQIWNSHQVSLRARMRDRNAAGPLHKRLRVWTGPSEGRVKGMLNPEQCQVRRRVGMLYTWRVGLVTRGTMGAYLLSHFFLCCALLLRRCSDRGSLWPAT